MTRARWIGGALAASAAAGPIVVAPVSLAALHAGQAWGWQEVGSFAMLLTLSIPFGFTFSLLPNVVGSALLAWVGTHHRIARHPIVWATTGELFGWLIVSGVSDEMAAGNMVLALVGAACALICRWRTRWSDDGPVLHAANLT